MRQFRLRDKVSKQQERKRKRCFSGHCVECGKRHDRVKSRWYCPTCLEKQRNRCYKRYLSNRDDPEYRRKVAIQGEARRRKLVAKGRCYQCGEKREQLHYIRCNRCLDSIKEAIRKSREKKKRGS
jgi:hypothetical protein